MTLLHSLVRSSLPLLALMVLTALLVSLFDLRASRAQDDPRAPRPADSTTHGGAQQGLVPRFISLNPYGAYLHNDAFFNMGGGAFGGLHLPDRTGTTRPNFSLGFTIPPDYASGTPLTVRLVWHTAATNCTIVLSENFLSIARPGRTHVGGYQVASGLTILGGDVLTAPATATMSQEVLVRMTSPTEDPPPLGEQPLPPILLEPGDAVLFGLFRATDAGNDTCTDAMVIQSVSVTYQGHTSYLSLVTKGP
jgi:hypothetical protein